MEKRLRINSIKPEGCASSADLREGDILISYAGQQVYSSQDLQDAMRPVTSGTTTIRVFRSPAGIRDVTLNAGSLGVILGDVNFDPEEIAQAVRRQSLIISTTPSLEGYRIIKHLDIITAECAHGMNVFKDIFTAFTDGFGGRSGSIQNSLREARKNCLGELREEALRLGANAVIGVDLDYSEFSGHGKSMLFMVASGTAVVVEPLGI